jgi:hypothetical protein
MGGDPLVLRWTQRSGELNGQVEAVREAQFAVRVNVIVNGGERSARGGVGSVGFVMRVTARAMLSRPDRRVWCGVMHAEHEQPQDDEPLRAQRPSSSGSVTSHASGHGGECTGTEMRGGAGLSKTQSAGQDLDRHAAITRWGRAPGLHPAATEPSRSDRIRGIVGTRLQYPQSTGIQVNGLMSFGLLVALVGLCGLPNEA